jgi:hypothetical protein
VSADRYEVGAEFVEGEWHVPCGRAGVAVDPDPAAVAHLDNLGDRLERPYFVIGRLAVHEGWGLVRCSAPRDDLFYDATVDPPDAVDRHVRHGR